MRGIQLFERVFFARIQQPTRPNETYVKFAQRCINESLQLCDEYEQTSDLFDPETGEWNP